MFKKAVITDEISQDFKEAIELALKYGLDAVEIRSVWEKGPHELGTDGMKNIRALLADTNLEVCCISSPLFKCDIDNKDALSEQIEILKRCIELAHYLGTGLIRGFTFWKKGDFKSSLDKIIYHYSEILEILEREDITVALESDPSVNATNAATLVQVIKGVNSARVKGLWDPGNDIYDPEGEIPYPDGYEIIKPYMVHMHLKDAMKNAEGKISGVPIGEGQVNYRKQFSELIKSGYNGYVVLETHYRPKHEISEKLLALPKGTAFSNLGYEATEECLIKWERLLKEIVYF